MIRRPGSILAVLAALAAWAPEAVAHDQTQPCSNTEFVLRVLNGRVGDVERRHNVQVVTDDGQGLFRVRCLDAPGSERREDELELEISGDGEVELFESNDAIPLPEHDASVTLNQSTGPILQAISPGTRQVVTFYGQRVWNRYVAQPATQIIRLAEARRLATGGGIVAVVDTGIDPNHPVLKDAIVDGYDFVRDVAGPPNEMLDIAALSQSTAAILEQSTAAILEANGNPVVAALDQSTAAILEQSTAAEFAKLPPAAVKAFGHGTMVAGLIRLVAPDARIMPLKAFQADGSSNIFDIARAIYYAADHNARVINMSFSLSTESKEVKRAVQYAEARGVICITSAGNQGQQLTVFPASWSNVLGVGSTSDADTRSPFSNFGSHAAEIAAPGEGLATTWPAGRFAAAWGTSFSSALASGAAALLTNPGTLNGTSDAINERDVAIEALRHAVRLTQEFDKGRLDLVEALKHRFRMEFGLPAADVGQAADWQSDPDGDGLTNLQEFFAGSHPRASWASYLAEGATGFFTTELAIANPTATPARALLRYQKDDGTTIRHTLAVGPMTRATVDVKRLMPALTSTAFSTVAEADAGLVMDRVMTWDDTGYGSDAERGISAGPRTRWYLAEGATHSGFQLFYLIQNPGATAAAVTIDYLLPAPNAPIRKQYGIPAGSRFTEWVNLVPGLAATDVSAVITSTNGVPILVERAMYKGNAARPFDAGHAGAGVPDPQLQWFLAEGATGPYFDLFVLVANPGAQEANVEARYLLPNGRVLRKPYRIAPNSRFNIWVDLEQITGEPGLPLADVAVSIDIRSTNGVPVIVERSMWWPGGPSTWHEAHNSAGTSQSGTLWVMAAGEAGGVYSKEQYVLVANVSATPGQARVTVLFEDGTTDSQLVTLPPNSRTNVYMNGAFTSTLGRRFSTIVESLPAGAQPAQIVVEGAIYSDATVDATLQHWAAGSDSMATRLR